MIKSSALNNSSETYILYNEYRKNFEMTKRRSETYGKLQNISG